MVYGAHVLGVDAGTQGVRAALYSLDGRCAASAEKNYSFALPAPGWAEQDPLEVWESLVHAVRECVNLSDVDPSSIVAICCAGTSSTVIAVDREGFPLRPAIMWMDSRAVSQATTIETTKHPILRYVGGKDAVEWMTPKALWIKENEPEIYAKSYRIVEIADWFMYKLSGEWTASQCNATCKWNYVSREGGWKADFFEAVGLDDILDKWPRRVAAMGDKVGELTSNAAEELGLREGIAVAQGGIDAHSCMVGLGVCEPGSMALILGTSVVQLALSADPVFDPGIWGPYPDAVIPNLWLIEGGQASAGSIISWFREEFAIDIEEIAKKKGVSTFSLMDQLASGIPPGAGGIIALDHFQGNRTPLRDPLSRGAFWGLSLSHNRGHLIRAIYESLAFGTRQILECWSRAGFNVGKIVASGGGAKSTVWVSAIANVCKSPVLLVEDTQPGCLGSAMCAAVACGAMQTLQDASQKMARTGRTIDPDPSTYETYDFCYDKYVRTYSVLRELMHEVAEGIQCRV